MAELKIKTHTIYTYETSDGREFDDRQEAEAWQEHLENIKGITMLDHKFCNTTRTDEAFYVHVKTQAQLEAFNTLNAYEGMRTSIDALGYWYYAEPIDRYVSVRKEIDRLQSIIESLDVLGK